MRSTHPMRILVVDDEPDQLSTLSEVLEQQGYAVVGTPEGEDAVEIADLFQPHVLITDFSLPGMDGIQTLHQIRERCPGMKSLLVSGYLSDKTRDRAEAEDVDRVFQKPVSL